MGSNRRPIRVVLLAVAIGGCAQLPPRPNIEVRMFHPWVTREGTLAKAGDGAFIFGRINRRILRAPLPPVRENARDEVSAVEHEHPPMGGDGMGGMDM